MKKLVITLFSIISFFYANAQLSTSSTDPEKGTFTLTIKNLESNTNTIYIGFYTQDNKFPKQGKHLFRKVIKPTGTTVSETWDDIPYGDYAIAVYQDLNENDKLETNPFGLPKEPYGFSTNFKAGMFSIPKFDKCKVSITPAHNQQTVSLIY